MFHLNNATMKFKPIIFYVVTVFYLLVGFGITVDDSFFFLNRLFLLLVLLRFIVTDSSSAHGFIKALTFCLLFAFPVLYFDLVNKFSYYKYLAISIFYLDLFLYLDTKFFSRTERYVSLFNTNNFNFFKYYFYLNSFLVFSLLVGLLDGLGDFRRVLQFGFFAISLLFLEEIARRCTPSKAYLAFFSYFVYVILFSLFIWSGFGRILVGTYILIPLILLVVVGVVRINFSLMFLVAPFLLIVAQISRHGDLSGFEDLVQGSSSSHLVFANRFYRDSTSDYFGGFFPWVEQLSLLYLNWFPSSLWDSKPIGLGSLAVDQWQGRIGVSEKYTLSPGLIGEQIYFLGDFFILGLFGSLISLLLIRFVVIRFVGNYVILRAIFYSMLFSLMWGGSATFGSRYWYYIIPFSIFVLFYRLYNRSRIRV